MDWEAIGALGEIIGAIAVVATLFYLAKQIKVSTAASERAEQASRALLQQESSREFEAVRRDLFSNPEVTRIFVEGLCEPEKQGPIDSYAFKQLFSSVVYAFEQNFTIGDNIVREGHELTEAYFRDLFRYPGARLMWNKEMHLTTEFADVVQDIFDSTEVATPSELIENPSPWLPIPSR